MWDLVRETSSKFKISGCRAGTLDCTKLWEEEYYEHGRCKIYHGDVQRSLDVGKTFIILVADGLFRRVRISSTNNVWYQQYDTVFELLYDFDSVRLRLCTSNFF